MASKGIREVEVAIEAVLLQQRDCLLAALKAIVETGDDCPACDRGVLRHPENGHWPTCPFGHAQVAIAAVEGKL